jgi:hypothetical protein
MAFSFTAGGLVYAAAMDIVGVDEGKLPVSFTAGGVICIVVRKF